MRDLDLTDRDFLCWIHERLEHVYNESPIVDFMNKLRVIITTIPANQRTPNDGRACLSLEELRRSLNN